MPLSFGNGDGVLQPNPEATVHAALNAGITFIDTADIYAPSWDAMGHNERIVAAALKSYDGDISNVVVATKGGITRSEGEQWGRDGTLDYLRRRAEAALTALETDQLDLFYLHRPDRTIVYSESMEALRQLVDDGLESPTPASKRSTSRSTCWGSGSSRSRTSSLRDSITPASPNSTTVANSASRSFHSLLSAAERTWRVWRSVSRRSSERQKSSGSARSVSRWHGNSPWAST